MSPSLVDEKMTSSIARMIVSCDQPGKSHLMLRYACAEKPRSSSRGRTPRSSSVFTMVSRPKTSVTIELRWSDSAMFMLASDMYVTAV